MCKFNNKLFSLIIILNLNINFLICSPINKLKQIFDQQLDASTLLSGTQYQDLLVDHDDILDENDGDDDDDSDNDALPIKIIYNQRQNGTENYRVSIKDVLLSFPVGGGAGNTLTGFLLNTLINLVYDSQDDDEANDDYDEELTDGTTNNNNNTNISNLTNNDALDDAVPQTTTDNTSLMDNDLTLTTTTTKTIGDDKIMDVIPEEIEIKPIVTNETTIENVIQDKNETNKIIQNNEMKINEKGQILIPVQILQESGDKLSGTPIIITQEQIQEMLQSRNAVGSLSKQKTNKIKGGLFTNLLLKYIEPRI